MGIVRFAVKATLVGGIVYYSVHQGVWSKSEDSVQLYGKIYNNVAPYIKDNIPKEVVNEEICHTDEIEGHRRSRDSCLIELQLSEPSIVDWISFCREVCIFWAEKNSTKLGGPNKIVEIDEAKIGKRKYNRGRIIEGKWIFGGYERDSKKIFLVAVPDRTEKTLLQIIKEWILPGTTIMSDCWKSYNCLNNEGFQHLTVNHSMNFVDPSTGAHTQHIERVWREVRANIPRYGTRTSHLVGYLSEYLFKRVHKYEERISSFFCAIAELYPPKTFHEEDVSEASTSAAT